MTAPFSVLAPITITDAILKSSTAPEADYPVWTAGVTFNTSGRCISPVTHRIYESLKDGNIGKDPTLPANQTGTTVWWLDVGPTNRWAMFDNMVSTATAIASPLTVVLEPGVFNSIALFGLDADAISVTVKDAPGGNVIYSYTGDLEGSEPADYYEYFYDRFRPERDFIASGIEPYNAAQITITLTRTTGNPACGMVAIGDLRPLGRTLSGAKAKPKTYSSIKTDEFGTTSIKRRRSGKDMELTALVDIAEANTVLETITDLLDVPCAWIGTDLQQFAGLRGFGLGSGSLSYDDPMRPLLTVNVQGMI